VREKCGTGKHLGALNSLDRGLIYQKKEKEARRGGKDEKRFKERSKILWLTLGVHSKTAIIIQLTWKQEKINYALRK